MNNRLIALLHQIAVMVALAVSVACSPPTGPSNPPPPAIVGLVLTGNTSFKTTGETSQIKAMVELSNGEQNDVSGLALWTTFPSIVATASPTGLLTTRALGVATVTASYNGRRASALIVVTPSGTFAATGRARVPGSGGLGGVEIVEDAGVTGVTAPDGTFALGGLTTGRLTFDKPGYERATLEVPPNFNENDRPMQPMMRITAGETVSGTIAPHDLSYDVGQDARCASCRVVRIINAGSGTLRLKLVWGASRTGVSLWIDGRRIQGGVTLEITTTVPVSAGELLVYVAADTAGADYVNFTLTTSFESAGT